MCHRVSPLRIEELRAALEARGETGRARVPECDEDSELTDAYPGSPLPLIVPTVAGSLEAAVLTWGFDMPTATSSRLVFNTRLDTALVHARAGRGMWAEPLLRGRCLIPVRSFYESWTREPPRRGMQVRFALPGHRYLLLAGIYREDRCSIVTTEPNAAVGAYHTRMPLVLAPGESSVWLGPDFACLADRTQLGLEAQVEEASPVRKGQASLDARGASAPRLF